MDLVQRVGGKLAHRPQKVAPCNILGVYVTSGGLSVRPIFKFDPMGLVVGVSLFQVVCSLRNMFETYFVLREARWTSNHLRVTSSTSTEITGRRSRTILFDRRLEDSFQGSSTGLGGFFRIFHVLRGGLWTTLRLAKSRPVVICRHSDGTIPNHFQLGQI